VVTRPARPGDEGLFVLQSGATLAGRLVTSGPDGDLVELVGGARVKLAPGTLRGVAVTEASAQEPPAEWLRLYLRDGRVVEGRVLERKAGAARLSTREGEELEVALADIRTEEDFSTRRVHRGGPADAGSGRYLNVPSAFLPGARQLVVGVSATLQPSLTLGLTSWLAATVASALPALTAEGLGGNAALALQASAPLLPWLRLSGGTQLFRSRAGNLGQLSGGATLGDEDLHLTLHAGPPLPWAVRLGNFGDATVAAGGTWRFSSYGAVVLEVWGGRKDQLGAAAYRHQLDRFSFEIGAMASTIGQAAPWLGFAWQPRLGF
jgi:hypothetical protein